MRLCLTVSCVFIFLLLSCRKDSFITSPDANVRITVDSLKFDTVFTTTGSVTQSFKIINENNRKLLLSSIKLMGGSTSRYKMNVDGIPTDELNNIELMANDSVYVFVQVNIDQGSGNLPFVVSDSIQVSYNGRERMVQLQAYGQRANFLRNHEVTGNETWENDLPYVILGYLRVNEGASLTLEPGARLFMHADAPIVIDGTLTAVGGSEAIDRISFQGDRLDEPYRNYPASWPGIYFSATSHDNILAYANIRNAYQAVAVQDPSPNANPKLRLSQCMIDNAYDAGIIAVNSSIVAINTLVSNCGKGMVISRGGTYTIQHCTVVALSSTYLPHLEPVLQISNDGAAGTAPLLADFANCIFWGAEGSVENEVTVSRTGNDPFTVNFSHSLWRLQTEPANATTTSMIANQSPEFENVDFNNNIFDFRLKATSPAVDAGTPLGITVDLDGKPRPVGLPDLGCYERQ